MHTPCSAAVSPAHLVAGIASLSDGGSLFICEGSAERRLPLDRGDVIIFRGDAVHAGTDTPEGHFGRIHCYLDSREVVHDRETFFGSCGEALLRVRRPRRVKRNIAQDQAAVAPASRTRNK